MKEYFILGCGGFAKEVQFLAEQCLNPKEYEFAGFIDLNSYQKTIELRKKKYKVFDQTDFLNDMSLERKKTAIINGIGQPRLIAKLFEPFRGFHFPNLIHPSFIGDLSSIDFGKGNLVTAGCIFTVDIQIGDFNVFNLNATVGHDVKISDFNVFNPGCNVSGGICIENSNLFGTNSTILEGLKVGSNSILGASALLTKNLSDSTLALGVPALFRSINR
ncbi:MAG: sugar O-acyltransferase (sialic acid O-acetyltransferase NeuD family) [Psychroserpens sp.]|jgi:sugar O-acyltransferase (sialic acid O-acetyltransferase NeuD family)